MRGVKRKKRKSVCVCLGAGVLVYHPACLFVSVCAHPPVCEFVAVSVCICCHSVSVSVCVSVHTQSSGMGGAAEKYNRGPTEVASRHSSSLPLTL